MYFWVKSHKQYLIYTLLLLTFFLSVNFVIYFLLRPVIGVMAGYLIDQLFFYFVLLGIVLYGLQSKKLRVNLSDLLVLLFLLTVPFYTHAEIFQRYFYKEDFFYNLSKLRDPLSSGFYTDGSFYTVYPFLPFVAVYYFFKINIFAYNLFTSLLISIGAFLLYKFNTILIPKKDNLIKLLSLGSALIYLTSPTYLETFLWVSVGLEGGLTNSLILTGVIFYFLYLRSKDNYFFLGSFVVLLLSLKTGFARAGYIPAIYLLLELLYLRKSLLMSFLLRCVLITIPVVYFLIHIRSMELLLTNSPIKVGIAENLYLLFAYLPHALIPFEVLVEMYKYFRSTFFYQIWPFHYNFYFLTGLIITFSLLVWTIKIKETNLKRQIIFLTGSALICLFFFVNFGSLGKINDPVKFDQGLSAYAITIGHRYYQGVTLFASSALFVLLAVLTLRYPKSAIFSFSLLIYLVIYNVSNIKFHNAIFITDYASHNRAFYEGILNLIPAGKDKKLLFLTNGEKWKGKIHADSHYLEAFYPPETTMLVYARADFIDEINKGIYRENDIYAFYLDVFSKKFVNQTMEYRKELFARRNYNL